MREKNKPFMEKTIDYVFPYVDCDDPSWVEEYNKYAPKKRTAENKWATDMSRFRSNDLLKYVFRSIEKNMPFIRKVHMIVMSDSQVPEWINRDMVDIIYHKDYIPEEYLPTFNSNTIETFMGKLPGVSERFIYGNDDMFITSPCTEKDFFSGQTTKFSISTRDYRPKTAPGDKLRYDDKKLITGKKDKRVYEIQHILTPYLMSTINEVFDKYQDKILPGIGRFRDGNQYNQWIFSMYQHLRKKNINKGIKYMVTEMSPKKRSVYDCYWGKFKAICLNDSWNTTQKDLRIVKRKLDRMFPEPSKYEIAEYETKPKKKAAPVRQKKKTVVKRSGRPEGRTWNEFFN